jgi:hypothetical protein
VTLASGRLSVPEYSVRVALRRLFSKQRSNDKAAGRQIVTSHPAAEELIGIYWIGTGSISPATASEQGSGPPQI